MGSHVETEFMLPPIGDKGEPPEQGDTDIRKRFRGTIEFEVVEGEGTRGKRVQAVAKRAGIPVKGYEVPFETRLKTEVSLARVRMETLGRGPRACKL